MTKNTLLIARAALDAALLNETDEEKAQEIFRAIVDMNATLHNM